MGQTQSDDRREENNAKLISNLHAPASRCLNLLQESPGAVLTFPNELIHRSVRRGHQETSQVPLTEAISHHWLSPSAAARHVSTTYVHTECVCVCVAQGPTVCCEVNIHSDSQ